VTQQLINSAKFVALAATLNHATKKKLLLCEEECIRVGASAGPIL
jgi:hypothetical protein